MSWDEVMGNGLKTFFLAFITLAYNPHTCKSNFYGVHIKKFSRRFKILIVQLFFAIFRRDALTRK